MHNKRRAMALLLALLFVFSFGLGHAEEVPDLSDALVLPGAMREIEAEAFEDAGMFERVVLPEGIESILSRAFAGSSLRAINLPGSITFIAEDAFDGSNLSLVAAPKGTYGHDWALEHGFLKPLTLSLVLDAPGEGEGEGDPEAPQEPTVREMRTGETANWTAAAEGGLAPYHYTFSLYFDGALVENPDAEDADLYSFTFLEPGEYYLTAVVVDENGDSAETRSETLQVTLNVPTVIDLSSADSTFETIKAHIWTASVEGGIAPYEYRYVLKQGSTTLYTRDYSEKETLYYTFFDAGSYALSVTVRDSAGTVSETVTQPFTVSASSATVSGVVRIYVDVDGSGNVIRDDSHTGHYELQINNSQNHPLAFDDRLYTNPAFSFQSGAGGIGIVAVSDGDQILRPYSTLYTFSFSTTAAKLKDFLITKMENTYLDIGSKTSDATWTQYGVATGPFTTYNISSSNCFTAVAAWSNWLGYTTLSNIVSSASNYTAYVAWRMLEKYGSYWTKVGTVYATPTPSPTATPVSSPASTATPSPEATPEGGATDTPAPTEAPTPEPTATPTPAPDNSAIIEAVIAKAESKLGAKYVYGGGYKESSPSGFDCSGFTYWSYYFGTGKKVVLGNSAYKQGNDAAYASKRVTGWKNCVRGDILCFKDDSSSDISHVGLYLGSGKFIHASNSAQAVIYSYFNSGSSANYWQRNLVWGYHVL